MKKILTLAVAAFLFTGVSFAHEGKQCSKKGDKKDCCKKSDASSAKTTSVKKVTSKKS